MRYIGNKNNLTDFIKTNISNTIGVVPINKLYDLFSGTGGIAEAFKTNFNVVGNDLLISSYIITNARLNGEIPQNIDMYQAVALQQIMFKRKISRHLRAKASC